MIDADLTAGFGAATRMDVDSLFGCNMSFRREALVRAGGFSKLFGGTAHLEETDVSLRLKKLGYRLVFDPEACLTHLRLPSGGCRPRSMSEWVFWYGHNYMLLFLRHMPRYYLPFFGLMRLGRIVLFGIEQKSLETFWRGVQGLLAGIRTARTGRLEI
jgi:GT2 family glycosyltransferase